MKDGTRNVVATTYAMNKYTLKRNDAAELILWNDAVENTLQSKLLNRSRNHLFWKWRMAKVEYQVQEPKLRESETLFQKYCAVLAEMHGMTENFYK